MKIHFLRHATLNLEYAGLKILVDPMFDPAATNSPIRYTPNPRRNPLVPLPMDVGELRSLLTEVDGLLVTHLHQDHWDETARDLLPRNLPVFCQPEDEDKIRAAGFSFVEGIKAEARWPNIQIIRTDGMHGRGEIGRKMAPVSGFALHAGKHPPVYIAGDTVWCDEVESALKSNKPEIVIVNAGAAQFLHGGPITMDSDDVAQVIKSGPETIVVAVHMEAINHCLLTRTKLRSFLEHEGISQKVMIPADGEILSI